MRSKLSKLSRLLVIGVVTAGASSLVTWGVYGQINRPRDIPAFSYEVVETHYNPETGEVGRTARSQHFIRGDGSRVDVRHYLMPEGTPDETRQITDLAKGVRITFRSATETTSTVKLPEGAAEAFEQQRQGCGRSYSDIRWVIAGYEVVRLHLIVPEGDGSGRAEEVESWVAPALGCVPLQITWLGHDAKVLVEQLAENIRVGEPDPEWFRVPERYLEMSPLEVLRLAAERFELPGPNVDDENLSRLEQFYRSNQAPTP